MAPNPQHDQRDGGNRWGCGGSPPANATVRGVGDRRPISGCFPCQPERGLTWLEGRKHRPLAFMGASSFATTADSLGLFQSRDAFTIISGFQRNVAGARVGLLRVFVGPFANRLFDGTA